MSGDGSISTSCPCVGIIDPGTIITMSALIFLRLHRFSFFAETKLTRPPKLCNPPPPRSPIPPPTPQPPSTPRKWSSPLHLGRLCRHLFSLFWQGFLRSSPLQPVYATRSPMLLRLPPLPLSSPPPPAARLPPFIWSSSRARCSDVFQSQLPASEDERRGGRGWREALPYLDKWTPLVSPALVSSASLCSESWEGLSQSAAVFFAFFFSFFAPHAIPHNVSSRRQRTKEGGVGGDWLICSISLPLRTHYLLFSKTSPSGGRSYHYAAKIENMLIIVPMNIQRGSYYSI